MNHLTKLSRWLSAACLPLLALLCAYALRPPKVSAFARPAPATQSVRAQTLHPATPLETKSQSGQVDGLCRAIVTSRPDARMRVQVEIPARNINGEWALPCVSAGSTAVPPPQSQVWIMFEGGNTHLPFQNETRDLILQ